MRRRRTGFTLIELVVVTLIMGILATAAVPRIAGALHFQRAKAAANRLAADLNRVAMSARGSSEPRLVHFNLLTHEYVAFPEIDGLEPSGGSVYRLNVQRHYGATIDKAAFADGSWFAFNGHGMPESSGEVVFVSGGKYATVRVEVDTGEIYVQE